MEELEKDKLGAIVSRFPHLNDDDVRWLVDEVLALRLEILERERQDLINQGPDHAL